MDTQELTRAKRLQEGSEPEFDIAELVKLRNQRQLGRRYLPFLKTLADFDIACEIGFHELSGTPLTVKQLMLLNFAPAVTVFRRLERLCSFGVILRTRSPRDGRVHELRLAPAVHRLFAMYLRFDGQMPQSAAHVSEDENRNAVAKFPRGR